MNERQKIARRALEDYLGLTPEAAGIEVAKAVISVIDAKDERIERLKMALGRIAYADPDHPEVESWKWLAREFMGIARAALAREAQPVHGGEGK